jgi:hypothetical protein
LPAALGVGAEVDQEGEDDDEPLEAGDTVRGAPHPGIGQCRPRQQEEAEKGDKPALKGAAEQVGEQPEQEQRQPGRDQGEEDDEAADWATLSASHPNCINFLSGRRRS